jgi:hypothetical protein
MARVKIESVVEHLDSELRGALRDAVYATILNARFDERALFNAFVRAVGRKCSTWERVPDHYVADD